MSDYLADALARDQRIAEAAAAFMQQSSVTADVLAHYERRIPAPVTHAVERTLNLGAELVTRVGAPKVH